MKQIDKTKDKQKHGKQRGKKDAVQLAVALKEQMLPFRVWPALFCGLMGSPRLELGIEEGLIGGVHHIRNAEQENADQQQCGKGKAETAPREHEPLIKRSDPRAAAKNANQKELPIGRKVVFCGGIPDARLPAPNIRPR